MNKAIQIGPHLLLRLRLRLQVVVPVAVNLYHRAAPHRKDLPPIVLALPSQVMTSYQLLMLCLLLLYLHSTSETK